MHGSLSDVLLCVPHVHLRFLSATQRQVAFDEDLRAPDLGPDTLPGYDWEGEEMRALMRMWWRWVRLRRAV